MVMKQLRSLKSIALNSKGKSAKAFKSTEPEEEILDEGSDNDSDLKEMTYLTKRFQYLTRKRKFLGRSNGSKR